jgi:hypothetical protein
MLVRPQLRPGSALRAMFVPAMLLLAPFGAAAAQLDEQACQRLRAERQSLMALGIDKHIEKGPVWAKERLPVTDLNLIKRYLDVFEQIKFRCDKIVALVEAEEKDDDGDDDKAGAGGALPPLPERRDTIVPAKSSATPAVLPLIQSNSAAKGAKEPFGAANASSTSIGPTRTLPAR